MSGFASVQKAFIAATDARAPDLIADAVQEVTGWEGVPAMLRQRFYTTKPALPRATVVLARREINALLAERQSTVEVSDLRLDREGILMATVPYAALASAPDVLEHTPALGLETRIPSQRKNVSNPQWMRILTHTNIRGLRIRERTKRFCRAEARRVLEMMQGKAPTHIRVFEGYREYGNALDMFVEAASHSHTPMPFEVLGAEAAVSYGGRYDAVANNWRTLRGETPDAQALCDSHVLSARFPHLKEIRLQKDTEILQLEHQEPFCSTGTLRVASIQQEAYERLLAVYGRRLIVGDIDA